MRPLANFTLHAILAAALTAFAATAAAAEEKSTKPRLAVLEFKWGTTADGVNLGSWAKADGLAVSSGTPEAGAAGKDMVLKGSTIGQNSRTGGGGANQMTMDDTAGRQKMQPGGGAAGGGAAQGRYFPGNTKYSSVKLSRAGQDPSATGASETITTHGNRTESGLPTGKRQHKPFALSRPAAKGSVWVRVSSPWAGCKVGERHSSLELAGGSSRYVLHDVTVASCGGSGRQADRPSEEVAFHYNKLGN